MRVVGADGVFDSGFPTFVVHQVTGRGWRPVYLGGLDRWAARQRSAWSLGFGTPVVGACGARVGPRLR
ncbi:hypothetical protein DFQ13_107216 [Actinokineospora spheciospongiae]|nr:hypothetical protein DFQ13_107216 [Actinokineospora spheciospongiae]